MFRKVRDFVEVPECSSLDALIERLTTIRRQLPDDSEPEVRLRGDDFFGRSISIAYMRPQTREEAECDARYADAYLESLLRKLALLEGQVREAQTPTRTLGLAA